MNSKAPEPNFSALLSSARKGDGEALEQILTAIYPRVEKIVHAELARDIRLGRPWLQSRFSTGDVVQEVFRELVSTFDTFAGETEEALVGYMATSVRHRLIDAIRFHEAAQRDGRRTGTPPPNFDPPAAAPSPASDLISAEESAAFRSALESFPPREQYLLRARIEGGTHYQTLADQLGYSSKAAARRAFHASKAILVVRIRQHMSGNREEQQ